MHTRHRAHLRAAFALVELLAAIGAMSLLLTLGYSVFKGVRLASRVAAAENRLKQVGVGLEMDFLKHTSYPPQGADLAASLAPYVVNPRAFCNPLMEEVKPGQTLSDLYRQPTLDQIDTPDHYITAFACDNGQTVVILKTGARVDQRHDLHFDPADPKSLVAMLTEPPRAPSSYQAPPPAAWSPTQHDHGHALSGSINLNPNNSSDFEFELRKPGGAIITRDDLHASSGDLDYVGAALWIRFKPKGNGNQNSLTLDGDPFAVRNGTLYTIEPLPTGSITVHLYNDKASGKGKAMGKWYIDITASCADITPK